MPNSGLAPYTPACNGQTYANTNYNYQAPYITVAHTDPIPLSGSSAGFLPNYANNNTMWYNTYGMPKHDDFGYETSAQFPFKPQLVEMTPARATAETCVDPNNLTTQLAIILRVFWYRTQGSGCVYQKSYPDCNDQLPYPRGYKVPEFSKFSGEDGKTTLEHVDQFILQCDEATANDALKLRMFPLFLFGTVFTWFTSLAPN
jgi:hypothetical protein